MSARRDGASAGEGTIAFEEELSVAVHAAEPARDPRLAARRAAANLRVLRTCEALEERRGVEHEPGLHASDAVHLEQKIDLLIELVDRWVARTAPRPRATAASLSATGLQWRPTAGDEPGAAAATERAVAEIHLRDGIAEPLRLPGRWLGTGPDGIARFEFKDLLAAETDALERFLFRQHRRIIAGQRRRFEDRRPPPLSDCRPEVPD